METEEEQDSEDSLASPGGQGSVGLSGFEMVRGLEWSFDLFEWEFIRWRPEAKEIGGSRKFDSEMHVKTQEGAKLILVMDYLFGVQAQCTLHLRRQARASQPLYA